MSAPSDHASVPESPPREASRALSEDHQWPDELLGPPREPTPEAIQAVTETYRWAEKNRRHADEAWDTLLDKARELKLR